MKTIFLILLLVSSSLLSGAATEPSELRLKSVEEKTYSPNGKTFGDVHQVVFIWEDLPAGEAQSDKMFVLKASRRLVSEREDLRYWKAEFYAITDANKKWTSEARITREKFVKILAQSERELRKQNDKFHFEYIYVPYHTIIEHETDLTPKLRKVLATTKGNVEFKNRGILVQFRRAFAQSESIGGTCRALQKIGLNFTSAHMEGDYYTPVDPKLAATWKDASKLDGFGLDSPPPIVFCWKQAAEDKTGKGIANPKPGAKADSKPESKFKD